MESEVQLDIRGAKKSRLETDFSRCLICQDDLSDDLVCSPTNYEKVLESVKQRSKYGDASYPEIYRHIKNLEIEHLNKNNVTRHRKCYQSTTNKVMIERAAKWYKMNISGQDQAVQ